MLAMSQTLPPTLSVMPAGLRQSSSNVRLEDLGQNEARKPISSTASASAAAASFGRNVDDRLFRDRSSKDVNRRGLGGCCLGNCQFRRRSFGSCGLCGCGLRSRTSGIT